MSEEEKEYRKEIKKAMKELNPSIKIQAIALHHYMEQKKKLDEEE